jgi:glyoxylase-like metal-dependent hydrolase (beta-lactamase superfamily II)
MSDRIGKFEVVREARIQALTLSITFVVWLSILVAGETMAADAPFTVHRYANPEFAYLNAYVVETRRHVVLVDAGASEIDGARIREMIGKLNKPVAAVLLTHGHIDHYGGIATAVDDGVPVIAGAGTARQIAENDEAYFARIPAVFPQHRRAPQRVFGHGQSLAVDGVTFTVHELGPGESYADVWWSAEAKGKRAAFIGDVAMYGIHAFFQSGRSGEWLRSLRLLQREIPRDASIYLGHDTEPADGKPTMDGFGKIAWQIAYIEKYREAVRSVARGRARLSDDNIARVVELMADVLPKDRLDFLVPLGANVVAAELAMDTAKAELEVKLRQLFAN